ncbi:MAG: cobalt ECF transporter T component CbiQ [Oscillospiraceae bacterium]|nr:cobalt ECF transporter T component CbiQ [Oscillospiraceae bacterium]
MNKMQKAIQELAEMDELAARSSPIHALHPAAKLIATVAYILFTLSFGKYDLSGLVPMALWPILLFQISGIEVKSCFYKLRIVLPLVMAVGLFNPFFDRAILLRVGPLAVSGGVVSMLTLMLKGLFSLMASFLLMATTQIDSLCAALRRLHFPKLLVTLLLLTYRYVGVMTEELAVMTDAYHLRAPGQKGIHISAWGSFLGQLLLRSMDRAQELYSSMLLRGYHQHFHYAPVRPFRVPDALYAAGCVLLFLLLRVVPVARLLGTAFVR